jgi:microcystin-dependent protein
VADPFLAEIRIFGFNFAPVGWAFCNGQIMSISQNTALFSLLGTTYGGNGKTTFGLPNLQGSAAMHPGQGQGLSLRDLGEVGGVESVTLLVSEIPAHSHAWSASNAQATEQSPVGQKVSGGVGGIQFYADANNQLTQLAPQALPPSGGGQPHNNMQPYLVLNFCIALQGIFPQRP